jgi:hypothetical protein
MRAAQRAGPGMGALNPAPSANRRDDYHQPAPQAVTTPATGLTRRSIPQLRRVVPELNRGRVSRCRWRQTKKCKSSRRRARALAPQLEIAMSFSPSRFGRCRRPYDLTPLNVLLL